MLVASALALTACAQLGRGTHASAGDVQAELDACREQHRLVASSAEVQALRTELARYETRANAEIERHSVMQRVMQRAMREYASGVCLVHGIFTIYESKGGKRTRLTDPSGAPFALECLGSGFLVSDRGDVVTNRHVAAPWWNNDVVAPLLKRGLEPGFIKIEATFPGQDTRTVDPATIRISGDGVDVAVFRVSIDGVPVLPLSKRDPQELRGERLMLLGYPTGLSALLARAQPDVVKGAMAEARDTTTLIAALERRGAIAPISTHGTLGLITEHKLVYDAMTTSGGSGGPAFGQDGTVIGVNFAMLRDFQGSNFGVPIRFVLPLIE